MKIITNRKSLFLSWLLSYAVILILPILLSFTVYFISVDIVTDKVVTANGILQEQLAQILDDKLADAEIMRQQITANTYLNNLLMSNRPYSNTQRYNIVLALKDFTQYMGANQVVKDFYIYVHGTDEVITQTALYDTGLTYDSYHGWDEMSADEWFAYLKQYHQRNLRVVQKPDGSGIIMILSSIPNLPAYTPRATLVMFISPDSLLHSIEEMAFAQGTTMLLLDADDQVVLSNREVALDDAIRYENLQNQPDRFTCEIGGEKILVLQSTSGTTRWKYVTLVSVKSITRDIRPIQYAALIFLLVSFIIGGGLSYWFTRKRYQPVHRILSRIGADNDLEGNEYDCIERNIDRILTSSERLEHMFERQKESVQNSYMTSLIQGGNYSLLSSNQSLLSVLGLRFRSDLFALAVIAGHPEMDESVPRLIDESLRREMESDALFFTVEIGGQRVLLVNFRPMEDGAAAPELLAGHIQSIGSRLTGLHGGCNVVVSSLCQGLDRVPMAYGEVMNLLADMPWPGQGCAVAGAHAVEENEDFDRFFTPEQEKALLTYLCAGNGTDACRLLDTIGSAMEKNRLSLNLTRYLMITITGAVTKAAKSNGVISRQVIGQIDQFIGRLWGCHSAEEMSNALRALLLYTADHIGVAGNTAPKNLMDDIIECVHAHYTEPDFNVSRLAEKLSMNLSYISKFFKSNAGIGLNMYINQVRINKAKEMLDTRNSDMNSILHQVGFENANSFIRVFKKFVGTTPGVYKDK